MIALVAGAAVALLRRLLALEPGEDALRIHDLSQPLNQDSFFWPYYPPFEVKYIKRKAEHGVNAQ
ncbi:MAG: hypothetical protein ACREMQ_11410, partial [Longimicrobiales bacterium]